MPRELADDLTGTVEDSAGQLWTQEQVADSILGSDNVVQTSLHEGVKVNQAGYGDFDLGFSDAIEEQEFWRAPEPDEMETDAEGKLRVVREEPEGDQEQEEPPEEYEQEQPEYEAESQERQGPEQQEVQDGDVHGGIAALDSVIEQHGLNDAQTARTFAADLCEAYGTDIYASGVDVEGLGSTMARTVLSSITEFERAGGDMGQMRGLSSEAAKAWTDMYLTSFGVDPRMADANSDGLANVIWSGVSNIVSTYVNSGFNPNIRAWNSPQAAMYFVQNWHKAAGDSTPVTREHALKVADMLADYVVKMVNRVRDASQRAEQQNSRKASRSRRVRTDNSDIFDEEGLGLYQMHHGRL